MNQMLPPFSQTQKELCCLLSKDLFSKEPFLSNLKLDLPVESHTISDPLRHFV